MLHDCLVPDLRLVICGTAAGTESASRGQYYAGPRNRFWRTLFEIGLTPRQLAPAEFGLLTSYGLGLTDIVKGQAGMDSSIDFNGMDCDGFVGKILQFRPGVLCFNGKKAAEVHLGRKIVEYGFQVERIGETRLFVATSTSGAANKFWDIGTWQALANSVGGGE